MCGMIVGLGIVFALATASGPRRPLRLTILHNREIPGANGSMLYVLRGLRSRIIASRLQRETQV